MAQSSVRWLALMALALLAARMSSQAFVASPSRTASPADLRAAAPASAAWGTAAPALAESSSAGPATMLGSGCACAALLGLGALAARKQAARPSGHTRTVKVAAGADPEEGAAGLKAEDYSKLTESVPHVLDNVAISKILPHRYPFLLVDKVVAFEPGKKAVGVKNVTANEPQFTGHFPDRPIMPGVLMVEAMAQLGGIVCLQDPVSDGKGEFFFAGIEGVKFRRPVVPGDTLVMEMELKKWRPSAGIAVMTGKAYVDGKLAVQVEKFKFALVKKA